VDAGLDRTTTSCSVTSLLISNDPATGASVGDARHAKADARKLTNRSWPDPAVAD